MYKLDMPIINENDDRLPIIKKLFEEILGYTEEEIQQFIKTKFMCDVVKNLTIDQAKQITEIFLDNDINIYLSVQETGKPIYFGRDLNITLCQNPPKEHYCDKPLVSRDHLVNPFTQLEMERQEIIKKHQIKEIIERNITPTITCPYCKSTNTKKISGLSKAVNVGLFGIFALGKTTKQWHCNNCNSDF
jgi:hypothetical protein